MATRKSKPQPFIVGHTNPRRGRGVLEVLAYTSNEYNGQLKKFVFSFYSHAWQGSSPFVWRYRDPVGKLKRPILDVFISRHVKLLQKTIPFDTYVLNRKKDRVPLLPDVRIYRSQRFPAFPDRVELFRLIPPPEYSKPPLVEGGGEGFQARRNIRVETIPNGARILNVKGHYVIEILGHDSHPSAFWYRITGQYTGGLSKLPLQIVHSPHVKIKVTGKANFLDITAVEVPTTRQVPWQGEEIDAGKPGEDPAKAVIRHLIARGYYEHKIRKLKPENEGGWRDFLADLIDSSVGMLPVIGDMYDLMQFAVAGVTGKDLFGRKVSRAELMLLGAAITLPVGISVVAARRQVKQLATQAEYADLEVIANNTDLAILENEMSPELRDAIRLELSPAEKNQLMQATQEALKAGKGTLRNLMEELEKMLGKSYSKRRERALFEEIEKGNIPSDFLEDLTGFDDWVLQEGYSAYLTEYRRLAERKGLTFRPGEVDNAIQWALKRQRGKRFDKRLVEIYGSNWRNTFTSLLAVSNRVNFTAAQKTAIDNLFTTGLRQFNDDELKEAFKKHRESAKNRMKALDWAISRKGTQLEAVFERELGDDWHDTLRLLRGDRIVTEVPKGAIEQFEHMHKPDFGIKDHAFLTENNKYFGLYFESDHLFGQQFWRNNPLIDSFDELESGHAILVPKNVAIRNLMPDPKIIPYDHQSKTKLIGELIPNGTEALWSPQQLWDVHVHVYQKLGASDIVKSNLQESFEIYQELLIEAGFKKSDVRINFKKTVDEAQFAADKWRPQWRGSRKPKKSSE